jgi:hypothetical protein
MRTLRERTQQGQRDEKGNLLLVALFSIIILGLLLAFVAGVMGQNNKTRSASAFAIGVDYSTKGLANTLYKLNTDQSIPRTAATADVTCESGLGGTTVVTAGLQACVKTWIEALSTTKLRINQTVTVAPTVNPTKYVYSRDTSAIVSGSETWFGGGELTDGVVSYQAGPSSGFANAISAEGKVALTGGLKIRSYNSAVGGSPSNSETGDRNAAVATNGTVSLADYASADKLLLYSSGTYTDNTSRCVGVGCAYARIDIKPEQMAFSTPINGEAIGPKLVRSKIAEGACDKEIEFTVDAVTEWGGVIPAGSTCITGDLILKGVLTVDGSSTALDPSQIFVTGNLYFDTPTTGVTQINMNPGATAGFPNAARLRIYSGGGLTSVQGAPDVLSAFPVKIAAAVYSPSADCTTNSTKGNVFFYGSLTCKTFVGTEGWQFWYDENIGKNAIAFGPMVWKLDSRSDSPTITPQD